MIDIIKTANISVKPADKKEILRYVGVRGEADESTLELLNECLKLVDGKLNYKLCYKRFSIKEIGNTLDLGFTTVNSNSLKKRLCGYKQIVLFAATVGIELDRLISRYSAISPAKAHMLQAIGAERIEALCDAFEDTLRAEGLYISQRFSAGYGDLSIELQRDVFNALECSKNIGLALNESFLMIPTKSVTAIIGIKRI